jgi:GNAT superfamily N-acetyltransferase
MEIRPVRPEEYAEAGRVTSEAYLEHVEPEFDEDWASYLEEIADIERRAPVSSVFVAVDDGRILGSATVEFDEPISKGEPPIRPDEARLRMVGVDPSARGRGVGQQLLDVAIRHARERGRNRLILNTGENMLAAQRMYERNGFVREDDFVFSSGFRMRSYALGL